jgi:hypothetical protein
MPNSSKRSRAKLDAAWLTSLAFSDKARKITCSNNWTFSYIPYTLPQILMKFDMGDFH